MANDELVRLVISFLGGGAVAGILNWLRSVSSEKKGRQAAYLSEQIQNLYGPLFFFTSQNEDMFNLNKTFQGAYSAEYVDQKWSQDSHTQENLRADTTITLDIANRYVSVVKTNNEKIVELLTEKYAYIDPQDVETFKHFIVDHTRMKTEINEEGTLETPFMIYKRVGDISFMCPEVIELVRKRFHEKKRQLAALH